MFYVLNFNNHRFASCDNAVSAENNIRELLSSGVSADALEIINGFEDEERLSVEEFRTLYANPDLIAEINAAKPHESREEQSLDLRGYQSADAEEYPRYPHDFGNGYKVETVYTNLLPGDWVNETGDEFESREDAQQAYPNHEIVVGFRIVNGDKGRDALPTDSDLLCKTLGEAVSLYKEKNPARP